MHNVRGSVLYLDVIYELQKGTLVGYVLFEKLIGIILRELIGMNLKIVKKILVTTNYWPKIINYILSSSDLLSFYLTCIRHRMKIFPKTHDIFKDELHPKGRVD